MGGAPEINTHYSAFLSPDNLKKKLLISVLWKFCQATSTLSTFSPWLLQVRTALTLEAKEDARRFFDQERVKLLQEIVELKSAKKQTDEALSNMIQSDKMKAGDLRVEHQQHQEQISKIKWDCERDIRRLVRTVTATDCLTTDGNMTIVQNTGLLMLHWISMQHGKSGRAQWGRFFQLHFCCISTVWKSLS